MRYRVVVQAYDPRARQFRYVPGVGFLVSMAPQRLRRLVRALVQAAEEVQRVGGVRDS